MIRYRVTDAKPIDDVLSRVERLEAIVEILSPTIDEATFNQLSDKQKKLFEPIEE